MSAVDQQPHYFDKRLTCGSLEKWDGKAGLCLENRLRHRRPKTVREHRFDCACANFDGRRGLQCLAAVCAVIKIHELYNL